MKKQEIKILQKKAFTLVELIIVITILAILATVAFVSFNGYTKSSRDANRLTTLTSLDKGLQTFAITTGKYPIPDDKINITDNGAEIGYQGNVGESVSRSIQASKVPTDPLDGEKYVYSTNSLGKKYQLMTFLETQNNQTAFISKSYADYSKRFPSVAGDNLGIILEENNVPVKRNIEIRGYTGAIIKAYLQNNQVKTGTGHIVTLLGVNYNNQKSWRLLDPNCDIDDIVVGTQVWAGCNSTLGDGLEWGANGFPVGCSNYEGVAYSGSDAETYCGANNSQIKSNAKETDWIVAQGKNGIQNNIWGKFYNKNTQASACPTGWKQPTLQDFSILTNTLNQGDCLGTSANTAYCEGLGRSGSHLKTEENNLFQALRIPLGGRTSVLGNQFNQRGNLATLRFKIEIEDTGVYVNAIGGQYSASTIQLFSGGADTLFPVRCIKN